MSNSSFSLALNYFGIESVGGQSINYCLGKYKFDSRNIIFI